MLPVHQGMGRVNTRQLRTLLEFGMAYQLLPAVSKPHLQRSELWNGKFSEETTTGLRMLQTI